MGNQGEGVYDSEIFDAVSALRSGASAWSDWRASRSREVLTLNGLHLGGELSAVSIDLDQPYDCYLKEYDFSEVRFVRCRFEDCDFRGTTFAGSTLTECEFRRCNLEGASFSGTVVLQTSIVLCEVSGCSFHGAELGDSALLKLDLAGTLGLSGRSVRFASSVGVDTLVRTLASRPSLDGSLQDFFIANGVPARYLRTE